jgi:hypothetical protein
MVVSSLPLYHISSLFIEQEVGRARLQQVERKWSARELGGSSRKIYRKEATGIIKTHREKESQPSKNESHISILPGPAPKENEIVFSPSSLAFPPLVSFFPIYLDCETRPYYLLSSSYQNLSIKTRFSISTTVLAFIKRKRQNEVDSPNLTNLQATFAKEKKTAAAVACTTYTLYKYFLFFFLLFKKSGAWLLFLLLVAQRTPGLRPRIISHATLAFADACKSR